MATINPLGGPINYMALTPQVDIAQSFTQGLQAGSGFRDVELREKAVLQKEADRQTALQVQQQYATDVQSAFASPDYETEFAKLAAKYPAQREALKQSFGGLDKNVRDNELRISTQALLAVENGKPEIAVDMINQSITAAKNSGRPTARLEQLASTVNDDPEKFKKNLSYILNTFDPESYKKIREGQIKDVEAGNAPEMAQADLAFKKASVLAPSIKEALDFENLTPAQQMTFQNLQILKKPPAAVTNVEVSTVDKTGQQELGKLIPDLYNNANAAASQIANLDIYRAALDKAITGPFAGERLSGAKIAETVGYAGNKEGIKSSRVIIQGLSEMTLSSRGMLKGQGQITKDETELLARARSGDINFTKAELKIIFDVSERISRAQYEQSSNLLKSAATKSPTAGMFLQNVLPLSKTIAVDY